MRFMPHVTARAAAACLFVCMGLGSLMIIAMSAWLNASALAGSAAHPAASGDLECRLYARPRPGPHQRARRAEPAARHTAGVDRFRQARRRRERGALTGTSGSGTVVQLLTQMSTQMDSLGKGIPAVGRPGEDPLRAGQPAYRQDARLLSDRGQIGPRSDAFGRKRLALMGVIASLQQTSVAPSVKRAADGLVSGFIAPAAGGRTVDLAERRPRWSARSSRRSPRRRRRCPTPPTRFSDSARRAGAVPAAVDRRGRAALRRRFHAELGRRHLDRPDAGGAGADPLRGARRHPPRRRPGCGCGHDAASRTSSPRCGSPARIECRARPRRPMRRCCRVAAATTRTSRRSPRARGRQKGLSRGRSAARASALRSLWLTGRR